ncbi:MAG: UvrD-helicase domain-containing protein [Rhodospirillales bacterium]
MSNPFELDDDPRTAPPAATQAPTYLDGLNDSQREAVEAVEGPVLVLAGAGTGKTRVLITRLGHILMQNRANPGEILAVTFTNKAAGEMKERVSHLVGRPVEGWWVGTFHAIGARMLRANAEAVGLSPQFTILDADDQVRLIKQLIDVHNIDEKRLPARAISGIIQRWKDRGFMPDKVPTSEAGQGDGKVLDLYRDYQARLQTLNAADFGDLLLLCLKLFQDHPDILKSYQRRFRYIMVDEYQDTNVAQYLWLRLLAQEYRNICCVGDDDQSIYSWRGAEVGNILRFEDDFPGARVVRLERNYRSTPHILAAASGLITFNEGRLGKTLWTDLNDGEKVRVRGVWDGEAEARLVGEEIEAYQSKGEKLNDMAVLVRAGFQTREFEERLITLGIPYRVIGGPRFYERQEIRDAVAYLRVVAQPDDDLAFERIVNVPTRGIGKSTLQTIHAYARAERISLTRAIAALLETDELRPQARKALGDLLAIFEMWRIQSATQAPAELCRQILEDSGYVDMWRAKKEPDAPGRLDNLKELVVALEDFESLGSFLEHVSLVMENEERSDTAKLSIMTLHGAKGLEFATVFLPGWEEGLFPNQRSLDEGGLASLEEERRLAYVGITRARKHAMISFAANRRVYGQWQSATPSRFIDELPADHIDVFSESGVYARQDAATKTMVDPFSGVDGIPRSRRRMIEAARSPAYKPAGDGSGFSIGLRVFHQKFGYGKITYVDGDKLDIDFEKAGPKRVMASFVLPA